MWFGRLERIEIRINGKREVIRGCVAGTRLTLKSFVTNYIILHVLIALSYFTAICTLNNIFVILFSIFVFMVLVKFYHAVRGIGKKKAR